MSHINFFFAFFAIIVTNAFRGEIIDDSSTTNEINIFVYGRLETLHNDILRTKNFVFYIMFFATSVVNMQI